MTTVAQMIQWMKTLPQDAVVECGVEVTKGYSTYMKMEPVDIDSCTVLDFTAGENRTKYPHMSGRTIVMLHGQ